MNIALAGKSGSGKTTVAEYLVRRHGYFRASTGDVCREVCRILFGSESRGILNKVTEAMKSVDEQVWLKAALRRVPVGVPVVFDSMRFNLDYDFLVARGYTTWDIQAPREIRWTRMQDRNQDFDAADDEHRVEREIEHRGFDMTIDNGHNSFDKLFSTVEDALRRLRPLLGAIWLFTICSWIF
jgi:dephospho-CoA kinase